MPPGFDPPGMFRHAHADNRRPCADQATARTLCATTSTPAWLWVAWRGDSRPSRVLSCIRLEPTIPCVGCSGIQLYGGAGPSLLHKAAFSPPPPPSSRARAGIPGRLQAAPALHGTDVVSLGHCIQSVVAAAAIGPRFVRTIHVPRGAGTQGHGCGEAIVQPSTSQLADSERLVTDAGSISLHPNGFNAPVLREFSSSL